MQPRKCSHCGNDAEYQAAFKVECTAARAASDASERLQAAYARLSQIHAESGFSSQYWTQERYYFFRFGVSSEAMDTLHDARNATLNATLRIISTKAPAQQDPVLLILAPAPMPSSLVFPVRFPAPGQTRAASLPCPSLWTALEVAAAVRTAKGALPATAALILPSDAASDAKVVGVRFRQLAKLLHPDRWTLTWQAARAADVPPCWVAVLDATLQPAASHRGAGGHAGGTGGVCPAGRCWTVADLQVAAQAAFAAAQDAFALLRAQ